MELEETTEEPEQTYTAPLPTMAGGGETQSACTQHHFPPWLAEGRGDCSGFEASTQHQFLYWNSLKALETYHFCCCCFLLLWTVAHQASLFMGFPRQGYWSGLSFPSPGHLSDPGIKPISPALAGEFITNEPLGKPNILLILNWQALLSDSGLISQNSPVKAKSVTPNLCMCP